jgi:outer membrane protein assembly factor BamB
MSSVHRSAATLLAAALAISLPAQDSDWPKYRGVRGDGVAPPQPLARTWGPDGPPELWRRPFGSGFSTVAAVGDRLYTMGATAEHEEACCLDARTGETLWRTPLGARFAEQFGDGPRATPTIDGDLVFAVSSRMHLGALAARDGAILWQKDLLAEFGIQQPRFGFSPSVVVVGNRAILEIGAGPGKAIAAFDRTTGAVLWTALDGPAGASTPLLVEIEGVPQLVFNRRPQIAALSLDGEVLWTYEGAPDAIAMASFIAPHFVFTSSAYMGQGGVMLRVTKTADGFAAEKIWLNRRFRNHFNNAVAVGGHLYGFDNSTLRCLDVEKGEITWSERGLGKGSLIACDDVLFVLGDQGTLVLAAADPSTWRELGRVAAMQGRCWTSPTLAAGRLYLRNLEELVAYDVRPPTTGGPIGAAPVRAQPAAPSALPASQPAVEVAGVLERYAQARGGLARWRSVDTLRATGTFSAFSAESAYLMQRRRDNLYRVEFGMIGKRDARGRDADGPWWQYNLFEVTKPARIATEMQAYHAQLERESMFEPALLAPAAKGIAVELIGAGEVDAVPTLDLRLTFPDGQVETWRLHRETCLEVAVDDTVVDMTQSAEPMTRRTFYSDFRTVGGLVLPFRTSMEFGARLEEIVLERVEVGPELDPAAFAMPAAIR